VSLGFAYSIRSFASKGPIDILASNGIDAIAIQVKSAKKGSYLTAEERMELVQWSRAFNARPIVASKKKGKWQFLSLSEAAGIPETEPASDSLEQDWVDAGV
jgi:Holliday junction resolvase